MTWVTTPPSETCGCGAKLYARSKTLAGLEQERATFREAHAACRQKTSPGDRRYIEGRCGTCDFPTDRLPCPWCVLRGITEVDGDGAPQHSQIEMYQMAEDAVSPESDGAPRPPEGESDG